MFQLKTSREEATVRKQLSPIVCDVARGAHYVIINPQDAWAGIAKDTDTVADRAADTAADIAVDIATDMYKHRYSYIYAQEYVQSCSYPSEYRYMSVDTFVSVRLLCLPAMRARKCFAICCASYALHAQVSCS